MLYQLCRQPKSPWHTKTYLYVICTWIIFRNCEHHNTYVWSNHWSIYGFYIHKKNTYILALLIHNAAKPPDMSVRRTEGQRWRYQDMATISASLARDSRHRNIAMQWYFLGYWHRQAFENNKYKTVELWVIYDTTTLMWRHCNAMEYTLCGN